MPGQFIIEYPIRLKRGRQGVILLNSLDRKHLKERSVYIKDKRPHISLDGRQVSVISVIANKMGITGKSTVKDGDHLNLTRQNIIPYTGKHPKRSAMTWSGYKGVYWRQDRQAWISTIHVNGKSHYLGLFKDPLDAAVKYDLIAMELFGASAITNLSLGLRQPILKIAEDIQNEEY